MAMAVTSFEGSQLHQSHFPLWVHVVQAVIVGPCGMIVRLLPGSPLECESQHIDRVVVIEDYR